MPYFLTLANRNDPISVAMPKVAKASTKVAVTCCCCQHYHLKYNTNINYPLCPKYQQLIWGIMLPFCNKTTGLKVLALEKVNRTILKMLHLVIMFIVFILLQCSKNTFLFLENIQFRFRYLWIILLLVCAQFLSSMCNFIISTRSIYKFNLYVDSGHQFSTFSTIFLLKFSRQN